MGTKPPIDEIYRKIPLKFHIGNTAWYIDNNVYRKGRVTNITINENNEIFYQIDKRLTRKQDQCFQSSRALARYLENESIKFYEEQKK